MTVTIVMLDSPALKALVRLVLLDNLLSVLVVMLAQQALCIQDNTHVLEVLGQTQIH